MTVSIKPLQIFVFLLAILSVTNLYAADKEQPKIQFAESSYSFGEIREDGDPVTHEFKFTNIGNAPLVIISTSTSCGCVRVSYPHEPINPGKTSSIKVTYSPKGGSGAFISTVKVRTNAHGNKKVNLKLSGTIKRTSK